MKDSRITLGLTQYFSRTTAVLPQEKMGVAIQDEPKIGEEGDEAEPYTNDVDTRRLPRVF